MYVLNTGLINCCSNCPIGLNVFDFVYSTGSNGSWYWSIGTSLSAPTIDAKGDDMNPAHVMATLRDNAVELGKPGADDLFGYGLVTSGF